MQSGVVSGNYRQLDPSEVEAVARECAEAWKDPDLPLRQYEQVVRAELDRFARGESIAPFDALVRCWRQLPTFNYLPTLLDVGASSGYYRDVLDLRGIEVDYTGCDFSPSFQDLARRLHVGIRFDVADARQLPYRDSSFNVVLSSACIMHVREYEQVIRECARVARRSVIFNRTPVHDEATTFFRKEAYGVPCLEIWFNEAELRRLFAANNLKMRHTETVFRDGGFSHQCYLLDNLSLPHDPA